MISRPPKFLLGLALFIASIASAQTLSLSGSWKYLPYNGEGNMASPTLNDSNWASMDLPSNWFLLGAKVYPEHLKTHIGGIGEIVSPGVLNQPDPQKGLDWGGTVWYRRTIDWKSTGKGPVILDVDMSDYYTDVYVNGTKLASHEGYFQKWSVDVTRELMPGKNLIALKVSAPLMPYDIEQQYPVSWPKAQNQIKGIFAYHDTRPGATSVHGQEQSTGGIIRGVDLRQSSGVDIENVRVLPSDVSDKSATLTIETTLHNWGSRARNVSLAGTITPANFQSDAKIPFTGKVSAAPGLSSLMTVIKVNNPTLWWSWDYGKPNLYQLKLQGVEGSAKLDETAVRFGIRSISHDDQWVFYLNGKRIYSRGSNYISTQWMSQADKAWYDRDVKMMIDANLNSIRVHAHLERPEFYEGADEQGIMVFQDFPLQWGYTDGPEFHKEALKQAAEMVERYGNYPSIILWCMHNESPHAMDWMVKRDQKQNLDLDNKLVAQTEKLDPSRVAHRDSGTGDGHTYPGWYEGTVGDFTRKNYKEKYMTEYGAQALPDVETLKTMFDSKVLFPQTDLAMEIWKVADFQPNENFKGAGIQQGANLEEFVHNSQLYQAQLTRFATEMFRRGKYTKSTGIYHFMFVEDWPSITWAVVDYYRRPKMGYQALKSSMQPVLASIEYQIDEPEKALALYVVNDSYNDLTNAKVCWNVGSEAPTCKPAGVGPDSVAKISDLGSMPDVTTGTKKLNAWVEANGQELGRTSLSKVDFIPKKPSVK